MSMTTVLQTTVYREIILKSGNQAGNLEIKLEILKSLGNHMISKSRTLDTPVAGPSIFHQHDQYHLSFNDIARPS